MDSKCRSMTWAKDKGGFEATENDPIIDLGIGSCLYVDSNVAWISASRKTWSCNTQESGSMPHVSRSLAKPSPWLHGVCSGRDREDM
jgi:hypothetical protein